MMYLLTPLHSLSTAPWCGHCKTLKPKLETVAQTFENDDDVSICAAACHSHRKLISLATLNSA